MPENMQEMNRIVGMTLFLSVGIVLLSGCSSPMHKAAIRGNADSLHRLTEKGKNIEKVDTSYLYGYAIKTTPLIAAAANNQTESCRILVKAGADINRAHNVLTKSPQGLIYRFKGSPIMAASVVGNKELVEYFVANGADLNMSTEKMDIFGLSANIQQIGLPLLNLVACAGNVDIAEYLMQQGLDPNSRGTYECEPLLEAAYGGHRHMVELLLENGATIDANELTPLPTALLSHIGAEYYAEKDEQQALLLYKQASKYYSIAAKQMKTKADDAALNKMFVRGMASLLGTYSSTPVTYHTKNTSNMKIFTKEYEGIGKMCGQIVELYGEGNRTLSECIEEASIAEKSK